MRFPQLPIAMAAVVLFSCFFHQGERCSGAEFALIVGDAAAEPGGKVVVPILAQAALPYQGLSLTVRYPPADLEVEEVGIGGTILEALEADFVHGEAFPQLGFFTLGVLIDLVPPVTGVTAPATDFPLPVGRVAARVLLEAPADIPLSFQSGLPRPAVENLFSVENRERVPQELVNGRVRVKNPPLTPAFIRGDATLDGMIDIADPIAFLDWRFTGGSAPGCEDAADANADDDLDLSDGIFLLRFLFLGGVRPPPPQLVPGPDPYFEGRLGCARPLLWLPARR